MTKKSIVSVYRTYSDDDKAALKVLQAEMLSRIQEWTPDATVTIGDAVKAVESDMDTPDKLKGV